MDPAIKETERTRLSDEQICDKHGDETPYNVVYNQEAIMLYGQNITSFNLMIPLYAQKDYPLLSWSNSKGGIDLSIYFFSAEYENTSRIWVPAQAALAQLLGLPENVKPYSIVGVGYPAEDADLEAVDRFDVG